MSAEIGGDNFMVIGVGDVNLTIPHEQLESVEPVSDLVTDGENAGSIGRVTIRGSEITVYAFDDEFNLSTENNEDQRFIICLRDEDEQFGLLANSADPYLATNGHALIELPVIMQQDTTIICAISRNEQDQFLQFSSAAQIHTHCLNQVPSNE